MLRREKTYLIAGQYPVVFESCVQALQGHSMGIPFVLTSGVQIVAANPQSGFITGYTRYLWRRVMRVDLQITQAPQGTNVTFRSNYLALAFIDYGRINHAIEAFFAKLNAAVMQLHMQPQPMAYLTMPDGRYLSAPYYQATQPPETFAQTDVGQVVISLGVIVAVFVVFFGLSILATLASIGATSP